MAKLKLKGKKKIRDQFVLTIGDEGAILVFFRDGKMENRIFVDSPLSSDTKLMEKLFTTYPKAKISLLVDVMEQNYSQQFLPPVSSLGVRQQIQRKIKRDYQPNDLNNVLPLGRSTLGRKDWSFLFISLSNTDPFSRWLDFVLAQPNKFGGVYLLPVEATKMIRALSEASEDKYEWEVMVLHNKTGGFRIVVLKGGKLIFTRLAQNLVGDNIPDIIVGNLEQEVANTIEYLKRLAFKGEEDGKLTIVAAADILQKVDAKSFKFSKVDLMTPFMAAEKLELPPAVSDKDKFCDILTAAQFASVGSHVLKFNSPYTKKIEQVYLGNKAAYAAAGLFGLLFLFYTVSELLQVVDLRKQRADIESELFSAKSQLNELQAKESKLPSDYKKMQEILEISRLIPKDRHIAFNVIEDMKKVFGTQPNGETRYLVSRIDYSRIEPRTEGDNQTQNNEKTKFEMNLDIDFMIIEAEQDRLENYVKRFEAEVIAAFPNYKVEITQIPKIETGNKFEEVNTFNIQSRQTRVITIPAKIKISGDIG